MAGKNNHQWKFPKNFIWGYATAAAQIEGAAEADGKGLSIWDVFARQPGKVRGGDTPAVACDHYRLWRRDIRLLKDLGARNYRFSVAWPRIFPEGRGKINARGLGFYDRLVDGLLEAGITPWVTMFHWDLPQALEDEWGGWRDRRTADAFAVYADTLVKALGDRVKNWITLNEIVCFTRVGYGTGSKAPGLQLDERTVNETYHVALLCHGHGVRAVREHGGRGARVGLTDNPTIDVPLFENDEDIEAVRRTFLRKNARVLEPIFRGDYTQEYRLLTGKDGVRPRQGDMDLIALPMDFLGLNIYTAGFVRAGRQGKPEEIPYPQDFATTGADWQKIVPRSLYWAPRFVRELYPIRSLVITENGAGYVEADEAAGTPFDLHRLELVRSYLCELHRAIADGVPVHGYFLWSLMDNYEWEYGYGIRFGAVHTNYRTQKRTPKATALWYREVMRRNAVF